MDVIVVLQVRMGSSRLPGKAMLPLDGEPALVHEIRRAAAAGAVDRPDVVVATSDRPRDDIIELTAERAGATVYRGPEDNVIGRVGDAVASVGADAAVRLCGDNTLVDSRLVDRLVETLQDRGVDYASTKFERTFPVGHNADAFTAETIATAAADAADDYHREHVAQYFKDKRDRFAWANVTADQVFDPSLIESAPEFPRLRLTMDEADDYALLSRVYESVPYDEVLDTPAAIRYVVEEGLRGVNAEVTQQVW